MSGNTLYDVNGDGIMDVSETNAKMTIELAFKRFDEDNSGYIDASELTNLIESLDTGNTMTNEQIEQAMNELDADGSSRIEKDEFITWWLGINSGSNEDSELRKRLRNLAKQGRKRLGTDIHKACWEGKIDVVQAFLATNSSLINAKDENDHGDNFRPLHYAAYQGHEDVCKFLLSKNANINAQTGSGCTALFFASQQGRDSIVRLLLSHRASASLVDYECSLGPVDVADSDAIRSLFKTVGKYKRPERPVNVNAKLHSGGSSSNNSSSRRKGNDSLDQVVMSVTWDHDPEGRANRRRDGPDESLPVSGFLIRAINSSTNEIVKEIDVPSSLDNDNENTSSNLVKHSIRMRLKSGNRYVFTVAGVNGLGRSKFSEPSDESIIGNRPQSKVPRPTVVEVSQTTATISWENTSRSGGHNNKRTTIEGKTNDSDCMYVIESRRIGDSDAWENREMTTSNKGSNKRPIQNTFKKVAETTMNNTMVQLDRLQSGSVYQVRLYMKNSSGNGDPGDSIEIETPMYVKKKRGDGRVSRLNESNFDDTRDGDEDFDERFTVHHR